MKKRGLIGVLTIVVLLICFVFVLSKTVFLFYTARKMELKNLEIKNNYLYDKHSRSIGRFSVNEIVDHDPVMNFYSYNISIHYDEDQNNFYYAKRWDFPKVMKWITMKNYNAVSLGSFIKRGAIELKMGDDSHWKYDSNYAYEDPRLFKFRDEIYVICYKTKPGDHKIIIFPFYNPEFELELRYKNRTRIEKNWMPFEYGEEMYILYSLDPFVVLRVDLETGECRKVFYQENKSIGSIIHNKIGLGSPPILVGEYYVCMAHIRKYLNDNDRVSYKNFLFSFHRETFECNFPSELLEISPKYNIEYGTTICEITNNEYLLVFGIQDYKTNVIQLCKQELLGYIPDIGYTNFLNIPVYLINLPEHHSRRKICISRIMDQGFKNINVFEAVNGKNINTKDIMNEFGLKYPIDPKDGKGVLGCAVSHLKLWKKMIDENIPYYMIFEDDIIFSDAWNNSMHAYLYKTLIDNGNTLSDLDIIFMGNQIESDKIKYDVLQFPILMKTECYCLHAYIITNKGAKFLLNLAKTFKKDKLNYSAITPIDVMLKWEMLKPDTAFQWVCWVNPERPQTKKNDTDKRYIRNTGLVYQDLDIKAIINKF